MKNKILFGALLFVFSAISIQSKAQLEVKTSGDVEAGGNLIVTDSVISENLRVSDNLIADHSKVDIKRKLYVGQTSTFNSNVNIAKNTNIDRNLTVSKQASIGDINVSDSISLSIFRRSNTVDTYYGIHSHIQTNHSLPTGSVYAICGFADGAYTSTNYPSVKQFVGVYGKAIKLSDIIDRFSAGVAGMANYYGGIGVYGGIGSSDLSLPTTSPVFSCYAGYFAGSVNVNGTLIATNVSTDGDLMQRENVQQIPQSLAENIHLLNPVSYTLKQDTIWKYDVAAKELQSTHYGLIAQDVKKIFPELVYERDNKLSINYIELIPLLIKTIQDLSTEVEELKIAKYAKSPGFTTNRQSEDAFHAILYQNQPNPFSVETKIGYHLPQTTRDATLYIYNMNGLQVDEYPISTYGEGTVSVAAGALDAGIYLYSLIADGQVIDTKRMILTK